MNIIRNIDISKAYGVSPTAVTNWIESAKKGKNQLQIFYNEEEKRDFVIDNSNNHLILTQLSEKGRVFKTKNSRREVFPNKKFYSTFDKTQLSGIILNLDTYKEISNKYTYINGGAEVWKAYVERSIKENIANATTNTFELTKIATEFLLTKSNNKVKFNIIDLGPGDVSPMRSTLAKLLEKDLINKYIAVDISSEMLEIAKSSIKNWFEDRISFQGYQLDISENLIKDICFYNAYSQDKEVEIINLVFFLGSTIENQLDYGRVLLNLRDSLGASDYLILGQSLDSTSAKTYFDFGSKLTPAGQKLPQQSKWITDLLGIEEDFYSVERYYDDTIQTRKMDIILNLDLTIKFEFENIKKDITFLKGDRITVWHHSHHSFSEITKSFKDLNLFIEFYCVSKDKAQLLSISSPMGILR
jgi:hypothetical protein